MDLFLFITQGRNNSFWHCLNQFSDIFLVIPAVQSQIILCLLLQMWKKFILFGNNQSNFKCPFKCRYIHSPKPFTVSDPVHMLFRVSLYICEWVNLSGVEGDLYITSLSSCLCKLCGLVGICVCLLGLFMGPNQGSGLKLAVAADWYVGYGGTGVPRSWTQTAVTVLWAAILICGRTFWRAARGEKSRVLLSSLKIKDRKTACIDKYCEFIFACKLGLVSFPFLTGILSNPWSWNGRTLTITLPCLSFGLCLRHVPVFGWCCSVSLTSVLEPVSNLCRCETCSLG